MAPRKNKKDGLTDDVKMEGAEVIPGDPDDGEEAGSDDGHSDNGESAVGSDGQSDDAKPLVETKSRKKSSRVLRTPEEKADTKARGAGVTEAVSYLHRS